MSHSAAVPAHHTPGTGPSPASGTTPAGGRRAAAPMISVRDLTKTFTQGSRTVEALRGVSLTGSEGAGKAECAELATELGIADRGIREGILRSLMARDGHVL